MTKEELRRMVKGPEMTYDDWRLRTLSEQRRQAFEAQIQSHTDALKLALECACKNDLASAEDVLEHLRKAIAQSIEHLRAK